MSITELAPAATDSGLRATDAECHALDVLAEVLEQHQYRSRYVALCGGAQFVTDHRRAAELISVLGGQDAALLRLIALGEAVGRHELAGIPGFLEALEQGGLVATLADGRVATEGFVVAPMLGELLLTGIPPSYARARAIGAPGYVGPDSLLLASAIGAVKGRRVLDMGAGCGLQGLVGVRGATSAALTDTDAFGLHLAALNVHLVKPAHPVSLHCGDGYQPLGDERFDLVICLPPYVPALEGCGASDSVSGGPDGLGFIRRMVRETPRHLSTDGKLVMLAQFLCDDDGPLLLAELGSLAPGCSASVTAYDWKPFQPYLVSLVQGLAAHQPGLDVDRLQAEYATALRPLGVRGVCTAIIELRVDKDASRRAPLGIPAGLRRASDVYRPVPGAVLIEQPDGRHLTVGAHDLGTLPLPTAALFAGLGEDLDVASLLRRAWGIREDAAAEDLLDQALYRLIALEELGAVRCRWDS